MADEQIENESYIFYKSFFDAMQGMELEDVANANLALHNYALYGQSPNLETLAPIVKTLFVMAKPQIDANKRRRENGGKGGMYGKLGGRPKKKPVGDITENPIGDNSKTPNVNDNENLNVNLNENEEENLNSSSSSLSDSQEKYAKIIFELFKNAGLPCQNGDYFKFLSCDFKNSLQYIKAIHSDEVIESVRNYITILKDSDSYLKTKFNFCSFVQSKTFTNCLPANFRPENFKKYETSKGNGANTEKETFSKSYEICPNCSLKMLTWFNDREKYICGNCKKSYTYEEINE